MKERIGNKRKSILQISCAFLILLAVLMWTALAGVLLQTSASVLCRNLLLSVLTAFLLIASFLAAQKERLLFSWNAGRMLGYTVAVCLVVVFLAAMERVPFLAAPVSAAAIVLTVFSGGVSGLTGYFALIVHYGILYGTDREQLLVFMLTGLIGMVLFSALDRQFRYAGALFAYLAAEFVVYSLFFVLQQTKTAFWDAALYLGIHLFAAFLGILILLKLVGVFRIYRDEDVYARINDPEYRLLVRLKEMDKGAYFHAIHTAYLSEKAARKIGVDSALTKAGGYYHKIGLLQGKDTIQNTLLVAAADKFPKALIKLLKEYGIKNAGSVSKEASIVQITDVVVSSIAYLFHKDSDAVLDYGKIIDVIIKKKMESGDFDHSLLTMEELAKIKKCFSEEKLYYDFLR